VSEREIGIGSRFLVLAGELRGRTGMIAGPDPDPARANWWRLKIDGLSEGPWSTDQLEGPGFKRLPDAPHKVDPLYLEVATEEARGLLTRGQAHDDRQCMEDWIVDLADVATETEEAAGMTDSDYRAAMMRIVVLGLAAIRSFDRVTGRATSEETKES